MQRALALIGLVVATIALSGCITGPSFNSPSPSPDYSGWGWAFVALGEMLAILILVILLVMSLAAIAVIALIVLAVMKPGPVGQAAAIALVAIGALLALSALPGGGAGGFLLGVVLAAIGAATLTRAPHVTGAGTGSRTVVLGEQR